MLVRQKKETLESANYNVFHIWHVDKQCDQHIKTQALNSHQPEPMSHKTFIQSYFQKCKNCEREHRTLSIG